MGWCNSGAIRSHRLPGSGIHRVTRAALVAFAEANGLADMLHLSDGKKVLVFGLKEGDCRGVSRALGDEVTLILAESFFALGCLAALEGPVGMVLDFSEGRTRCAAAAKVAREKLGIWTLALGYDDELAGAVKEFELVLVRPEAEALAGHIARLAGEPPGHRRGAEPDEVSEPE
jgi:hypothetical protein